MVKKNVIYHPSSIIYHPSSIIHHPHISSTRVNHLMNLADE
jgi:hypothetical protein